MTILGITVTAVKGERAGQRGTVTFWPIFDRQDWVNVAWEDGTISTAYAGEIIAPDEETQLERRGRIQARLGELDRKSKRDLLSIMANLASKRSVSYLIGGPHLWSRDELIYGILGMEFPAAETARLTQTLPGGIRKRAPRA